MYESPINVFETASRMIEEINKQKEEHIFKAIQEVGVSVDKQELIRALSYDREQYDKGFNDGYIEALENAIHRIENSTVIAHRDYVDGCYFAIGVIRNMLSDVI